MNIRISKRTFRAIIKAHSCVILSIPSIRTHINAFPCIIWPISFVVFRTLWNTMFGHIVCIIIRWALLDTYSIINSLVCIIVIRAYWNTRFWSRISECLSKAFKRFKTKPSLVICIVSFRTNFYTNSFITKIPRILGTFINTSPGWIICEPAFITLFITFLCLGVGVSRLGGRAAKDTQFGKWVSKVIGWAIHRNLTDSCHRRTICLIGADMYTGLSHIISK